MTVRRHPPHRTRAAAHSGGKSRRQPPETPPAAPPARPPDAAAPAGLDRARALAREHQAHYALAVAVLEYAAAVQGLPADALAELEALRGPLGEWRKTGEALSRLPATYYQFAAATLPGVALARHDELRQHIDTAVRQRREGSLMASVLFSLLTRPDATPPEPGS